MIRRILSAPLLAALMLLSACGWETIAASAAGVAGGMLGSRPAAEAPAEQMDPDKVRTRVRLATAAFDRTTEAFQSGKLPASTSPDTAHPKFCDMVIQDLAQIGADDVGGDALALICKVRHHLHQAKAAYENPNPDAYAKHIAAADGFIDQLNAILAKAKGPSE